MLACAITMAIEDSVTVSIGELMTGLASVMFFVRRVLRSTCSRTTNVVSMFCNTRALL